MCGISVVFQKHCLSQDVYNDFLLSLRKINHRGPDDEGVVLLNTNTNEFKIIQTEYTHTSTQNLTEISSVNIQSYNLLLGHRRLNILDLTNKGHQPMQGTDGSWIVFNGEIYNYIELKEELRGSGSQFKTNSDTEVILEAYRIWGKNCLNKFNGMWSICIWDAPNKTLFTSNDRFGVKPLYHYEHQDGFHLVSETKQFKCFSNIAIGLNKKHLDEFAQHGMLDSDQDTMYTNIHRFKKANYSVVDPLKYVNKDILNHQICYYSINKVSIGKNENQAIEQFRELLYNAVKIRMRADVDFGFALSGGLDSSAILYMAKTIGKHETMTGELIGFSAVFPGFKEIDESAFIKIVADDLPCKTNYINPIEEFSLDAFENHIYFQDEPVHSSSAFSMQCICKKVKAAGVKIIINGQGADEVFAGYHHHFYRYCRQILIKGKLPEYFSLVRQYAELKGISKKRIHSIVVSEISLAAKIKLGIAKFDHALLKYWNKIDTMDEMLQRDFDTFQLPYYLRYDDRSSMVSGVESRHPFLDYNLVEFGYSLPNNLKIKDGWQKYIIRKSMHEIPNEIAFRKDKKGFLFPQDHLFETYSSGFGSYLDYNERTLGVRLPSKNKFDNYAIGAWLRVNNL